MPVKVSSAWSIHAVGAAALVACLGVGAWYGFLNPDRASGQIDHASQTLGESQTALKDLEAELSRQTSILQERKTRFGKGDLLPEQVPIEDDLRSISEIAGRNNLDLVSFTPTASKSYPGVSELRYDMVANGQFLDFVGFMRDFQKCDSWADIISIDLEGQFGTSQHGQRGKFTISLYSAARKELHPATTRQP